MDRVVMYVDMDAYFASVEQASRPYLRGRPVAVVGSGKRAVIVASSYEAKRFGIKTGMTRGEAEKKLPSLVFVEGRNDKYVDTCVRIREILLRYTPEVEICSIDEFFADLTGSLLLFPSPADIAAAIKREIGERFGITCSVGIAPNKLVAKIAGELGKPDGLVSVEKDDVERFMEGLPVESIPGIGKKTGEALKALGITICRELMDFPVSVLRRRFGIRGDYLSFMARGIDPFRTQDQGGLPGSIGHSMTFEKNIGDRRMIRARLLELSGMVARRLRKEKVAAKGFSLTLRYPDFTTFTKRTTLPFYTVSGRIIYETVTALLDSFRLKDAVRLLGVSAFNIRRCAENPSLFGGLDREERLWRAVDDVNDAFGEFSLHPATALLCSRRHWVISPAYRPGKVYPYRR
ncbi:MAG TPA: DNA polymerase IV [Syntrophorhabdaceae bacterium]|nr:DNA polymerase IV [Syntrophorhabdaceae bacterium]HQM81406.1 DNA polymerase IV [Syntrophorhabdaceae bacterium]